MNYNLKPKSQLIVGFQVFVEVFDSDFDIPWTKTSVKELIWNVVQEAMFKTTSIKELERDKVTAIYDVINRKISQKTGIFVPFPNRDNML